MFEKLSREAVESGLEHPFVRALVKELREQYEQIRDHVIAEAAQGQSEIRVWQRAARAQAFKDILGTIERAAEERWENQE